MPTLETERLILRDFVLTDWDALNTFLSDPSVTRFMHFASWDEGKRHQWLASLVQDASNPHRDTYNWAITLRSNGLLIGWLIIKLLSCSVSLPNSGRTQRTEEGPQVFDQQLRFFQCGEVPASWHLRPALDPQVALR